MQLAPVMASDSASIVSSVFELATQQKRVRHLKSVAVRNIIFKNQLANDINKVKTFFTLHTDKKSKAFYTSEKISGSLNPTWQAFDLTSKSEEIDTSKKSLLVRVWVGQDVFKLFLEWELYFSCLQLQDSKALKDGIKFPPNSLVFGMFDQFFTAPSDEELEKCANQCKDISSSFYQTEHSNLIHSYGLSSLYRINTILRAIKQNRATAKRLRLSIQDQLEASKEKSKKLHDHEERLLRVRQLHSELEWQKNNLQSQRANLECLINDNHIRRTFLREQNAKIKSDRIDLEEKKKTHNSMREHVVKENAQLWIRRKQLITELAEYIYPITENSKKEFFICDVKLPNAEEIQGHDDTMIAVGLGYTCHMILMLSRILNLPLRYPVEYRGSRSQIQDHIHTKLTDRERNFPLYSKGKKDFYFQYGVFLLNKNISQLRWYCGLGTADLRLTLPNLKSLLELRLGVRNEQAMHRLSPVPSNIHQDSTSPSGQMLLVDSAAGAVICEIDEFHGVVDGSSKLSPEAATELATEATSELPSPSVPNSAVSVTEDMFEGTDDHFFRIQRPVSKVFSLSNESFLNTVTCDSADTDHNQSTGSSSGDVSKDNAKLMSTWLKKVSPDPDSPSSIRSAGSSPKLPYRSSASSLQPKLIRPVLLRETSSDSAMSLLHSSSSPPKHHHHPQHSASSSSLPQNSKSQSLSQQPLSQEEDPELHSTLSAAILAESSQSYWLHRPDNVCNSQIHRNNDCCDGLNSI